jgi:serine protease Do
LRAKDKTDAHPAMNLQVDLKPIDRSGNLPVSYAPIVKKAAPSVVYISTSKKVKVEQFNPFFNDPMFRRFFGVPGEGNNVRPMEQVQHSLGSGIILTSDGYILTNNHVIDGADDIKVSVGTPRKEYQANVVGRDSEVDVAVLKINATGLPAATLGDSDQIQVGDTVLAIGDPFGVGLAVTHGIVSALGRNNLNIEAFEDFIQTDAPINPGNSGGALIDSQGRVVGMNTAILSHSGGSNGVGFAIPINLIRSVAGQLVSTGKVSRGFLGVELQELTPELAAQFGTFHGALISEVSPGTPADKAGLKAGDVITKLNGKSVDDYTQLRLEISELAPGTEVALEIARNGQTQTCKVTLGNRPSKLLAGESSGENQKEGVLNGVTVGDITADLRQQLQLPSDLKGAVITDVDADSASARAGLARGDVILELDRKPVLNADEAVRLSADIKGPKVLVRLWRGGGSRYVVVDESQ